MESHLSLSFLADLEETPTDEDVGNAWQGRLFPLVCTAYCETNWKALADRGGRFVTSSGARCRVEPRLHHAVRFSITNIPNGDDGCLFLYEAVVFGKVAYQLWLNETRENAKTPGPVCRRLFVDRFVRRLPARWRTLIIHFDLHLYDDHAFPDSRTPVSNFYHPLKSPQSMRLIALHPNKNFAIPIQCTLAEVELVSGQEYEALSYVWGDRSSPRSIL